MFVWKWIFCLFQMQFQDDTYDTFNLNSYNKIIIISKNNIHFQNRFQLPSIQHLICA